VEGTSSDGRDTTRLRALFAPSTRSDGTAHVDFCTMLKGRFGSKSAIRRSSANDRSWRIASIPMDVARNDFR
jgi:hypothetical protein